MFYFFFVQTQGSGDNSSKLLTGFTFAKKHSMLLVADGGATKIDWAWTLDAGETAFAETGGFNPTYGNADLREKLKKELADLPHPAGRMELYYYGAGCRAPEAVGRARAVLQAVWPQAEVNVFDDLLGAARATCGTQPGIVCILGTGSNSMCFDGEKVVDQIPNLGVLLGDEGSGAHIGKELLRAYFYREMPDHIRQLLSPQLPGGRDEFIKTLYAQSNAGSFLASFVKLVAGLKSDAWLNGLVQSCLEEFVQRHVLKYPGAASLPVHFCGSIAWHFGSQLDAVLQKHSLRKGKVLRKPIAELFKFHLNNASSQPFTSDRKNS